MMSSLYLSSEETITKNSFGGGCPFSGSELFVYHPPSYIHPFGHEVVANVNTKTARRASGEAAPTAEAESKKSISPCRVPNWAHSKSPRSDCSHGVSSASGASGDAIGE